MEKRRKRVFDEEFKAEAVKLVVEGGKSQAKVARDLDVVPSVLARWITIARTEAGPKGIGPLKTAEREELTSLRKRVRVLEMEGAFLKKAAAFFARGNS